MYWVLRTGLVTTTSMTRVKTKSRLTAAEARRSQPARIARARSNHQAAAAAKTARVSHLSTVATLSAVAVATSQAPKRIARG